MAKISSRPLADGKIFIGTRVPKELRDKLNRRAKRERRSMACEMELILTHTLAKD